MIKPTRHRNFYLFAIVAVVMIASGFYVVRRDILSDALDSWACHELISTTTAEINSMAHVALPANAADAHLYAPGKCTSPRPFYLVFQLKQNELDAFIRSTRIEAVHSGAPVASVFSNAPDAAGWDVGSVKSALYGLSRPALDYQQHILIDTSDTKLYRVYFVTESYD